MSESIGTVCRRERERLGISREELAKVAGLEPVMIDLFECDGFPLSPAKRVAILAELDRRGRAAMVGSRDRLSDIVKGMGG